MSLLESAGGLDQYAVSRRIPSGSSVRPPLPWEADTLKPVVAGVGVDAPMTVNAEGGKQSETLYAFDALDPHAIFAMCQVLLEGRRKYGTDENWRKIPPREHWNHLVIHAFAWLARDKSDDHLSHILCRAMFLYATDKDGK